MPVPVTEEPADHADSPGLPLLHSWPSVYAFVLIVFALIVMALTLFRYHFMGTVP